MWFDASAARVDTDKPRWLSEFVRTLNMVARCRHGWCACHLQSAGHKTAAKARMQTGSITNFLEPQRAAAGCHDIVCMREADRIARQATLFCSGFPLSL